MMANKVKAETHIELGESHKEMDASFDDTTSKGFDPTILLPYGEASKNAPDVTVEESLKRRREAKTYMKQRKAKLKYLLNNDY